jgi:hypothetical protein
METLKKYEIYINFKKLLTITAQSYRIAEAKAKYLYGHTAYVKEIPND